MAQDNEEPTRIDPDTDSQELDPRVRDALRDMMRDGDDYTRYGNPPQDRNWRNPEFDRFQQAPERPDTSAGGIVNAIRSGTVGDMIGQELSARQYQEMQRRAEQSEMGALGGYDVRLEYHDRRDEYYNQPGPRGAFTPDIDVQEACAQFRGAVSSMTVCGSHGPQLDGDDAGYGFRITIGGGRGGGGGERER